MTTIKNKISGFIIVLAGFIIFQGVQPLYAQNDRQLTFLPIVPHGRTVNPAFTPEYSFYLGIPVLSNITTGFENTIQYDNIFQTVGDSLVLDREYILSNLDDETHINFNLNAEYFTLGFKAGKNYFHFRVAEKAATEFMLRKEVLEFAFYGNGHEKFLGKTVNLGGSTFDVMAYREYSLGYSRAVNDKLNVGANFKYLQGLANINTAKTDFLLTTNEDDFSLMLQSDMQINLSVPGIDDDDIEPGLFLPGSTNSGFAFDVGAEYKINRRFEAHAALLNVGSIKWTENLKNYETEDPGKIVNYDGFDIGEYFTDGTLDNDRIENVFDSIADELGIKETARAYTTKLSPVLNAGGRFNLSKNGSFNVLLTNRFQTNTNWTTFSVAYTHQFGRNLNLMVSNTVFNDSFLNPGAGIAANLGPLQIFAVAENIIAPLNITETNIFNLRFGVSIVVKSQKNTIFSDSPVNDELINDDKTE
jgi:hypothetical protein